MAIEEPPNKRLRHHFDITEHLSDSIIFNVGGRRFEVLRETIERRKGTHLARLIKGADDSRPVFVDANPDRFECILDWYRYGEIFVDKGRSVAAVLRDADYFLLPDTVKINGETHKVRDQAAGEDEASGGNEYVHPAAREARHAWYCRRRADSTCPTSSDHTRLRPSSPAPPTTIGG